MRLCYRAGSGNLQGEVQRPYHEPFRRTSDGVASRYITFLIALTVATCAMTGVQVGGYGLTWVSWSCASLSAVFVLARWRRAPSLPLKYWLPWLSVLTVSTIIAGPPAFLRYGMQISPFLVGLACSTLRVSEQDLARAGRQMRKLSVALLILYLLRVLYYAIIRDEVTIPTSAAEVSTMVLCGAIFATYYAGCGGRWIWFWASTLVPSVLTAIRVGPVVGLYTLGFTPGRLGWAKRALIMVVIAIGGALIFSTEGVRSKMFGGKDRDYESVWSSSEPIASNGRFELWASMIRRLEEAPILGHGANASEEYVRTLTQSLTHPHNDWLRISYDHGLLGVVFFGIGSFCQIISLIRQSRAGLVLAGGLANSFCAFALFMITDNILLYSAHFGNLQFGLLGLLSGYNSSMRRKKGFGKSLNGQR